MAYQIQVRSDIASNWSGKNPVLAQGEPGYETDTGKLKYGDGVRTWSALPYFSGGGSANITPAGGNTQIQFNLNGALGASSNLRFITGNLLSVGGTVVATAFSGSGNALNLSNIGSNIIPAGNAVYSLGTPAQQWKELYVSGNTIWLGGSPLSIGANASLTYRGAPVVTTSGNASSTTQIAGSIAISGNLSSNTVIASNAVSAVVINSNSVVSNSVIATTLAAGSISGNGAAITGIRYSSIVGAYGNSNVAAFLPNYSGVVAATGVTATGNVRGAYLIGNGALITGIPNLNYSNANVAAYLPTYAGVLRGSSATVTGNVTAAYFLGNVASATGFPVLDNYSNANVAAYLPTDPTIIALQSEDANLAANLGDAWIALANTNGNVSALESNVAAVWTTIGVIEGNIASLEANVYSNANTAAFLANYTGSITADAVTANTIAVGDSATPGAYFIEATANSVSLGQTGGQTLSFSDTSGITLAGTGGVTVMGAAGATVTIGGGTSGPITVASAIDLGAVGNVHIGGGSAGQILATSGSGNLYWTNDATNYGNSNVANFLPGYGGNIAVDVVTATGNVDAGTNYFIGNGALLTGLDAATGYSNSNVEALLPVYTGNISASMITANVAANTITVSGNATAAFFVGDGSQLTNLPVLDNYSNANVAAYLPVYGGNVLGNVLSANSLISNTITANITNAGALSASSASVTGNVLANILTTPNNRVGTPRANGNTDKVTLYSIPGNWNYALGTDSTRMWFGTGAGGDGFSWYTAGTLVMQTTGPDLFVEGEVSADTFTACSVMSTATVSTDNLIANNVISVDGSFSGNLQAAAGNIDSFVANTIVANSVTTAYDMVSVQSTANTIILGNATTAVNQIAWATTTSSGTGNATLFSVAANAISSIDFGITATSGNNRQVAKILAVTLGNNFNYTEYGSLSIGSLLGNFFVDVIAGNLVLQVQPFVSANVHYSLIMDYDYDLHQ